MILIVWVFCAAARAQSPSLQAEASGNALVATGKVLAYGGLGLAVLGYYPVPRLAGLLAFGLGVPMTGLGAGQLTRAAQGKDSGYHANPRGWGWNLAGTALVAVGIPGVATLDHGGSPGEVFGGVTFIAAGLVCDFVSLIKFSNYAGEARDALASHRSVDLEPLWLSPQGRTEPGLRISYRF